MFNLSYCCCYYDITIKPMRAGPWWGAHQPDAVQKENKEMVPETKHINTWRKHYKALNELEWIVCGREHHALPVANTAAAVLLLSCGRESRRARMPFSVFWDWKMTCADQLLRIKPRAVWNEKHNAEPEMSVLFTYHKHNKRLSKIKEELMNYFRLNESLCFSNSISVLKNSS